MLKLSKISLEGYKSIRQCRDLALGPLNVLIGANGSGKSNLISLFPLLSAAMRGEFQLFIGTHGAAHSILHFGPKVTPELAVSLEFDSESETNLYAARLVFAAPDNLVFGEETFRSTPKEGSSARFAEAIARGANESAVVQPGLRENERLKLFARLVSGIWPYHFIDTTLNADVRLSREPGDHRRLYSKGENLAPVLRMLRDHHPESYARILETLRLIAPFFGDFVLDPSPTSPGLVMLNWRARGSDYEFGPHQLSDGTLRFIALATLLLQPVEFLPGMIIIDEPELGLHPFAIKILASLLADAAERTQVLVATQSSTLVDEVEPHEVIVANLEEGLTTLKRLDPERLADWLQDYTLSQVWESNLFGGKP